MNSNLLKLVRWAVDELTKIRQQLDAVSSPSAQITSEWISWKAAMQFFNYKDTQMAEMALEQKLVVTKVGRRKYIKRSSIIAMLERNVATTNQI